MKLPALDIPETHTERAVWLERSLVGLELRDLVVSLKGLQEPSTVELSVEQILGNKLESVLHHGLSSLDRETLKELLRSPDCLLGLQERIFTDGGEYWDRVERSSEHQQHTRTQGEHLRSMIEQPETDPGDATPAAAPPSVQKPPLSRIEYVLSAVAAVLLVGFLAWLNQSPSRTGWGFDRPGTLARQMPADQYLNHLAGAADEWFNKRPDNADALSQRLTQFIHGCQTLIDAPHSQLSDEDRDWLRERCGVWKENLEKQLAGLKSDSQSVDETLKQSDEIVKKLIEALRTRAGEVS